MNRFDRTLDRGSVAIRWIALSAMLAAPGCQAERALPADLEDSAAARDDLSTITASGAPNLLVIMVDDLDEGTFDLLLGAGKLPSIKSRLIDKGRRFTSSFVTDSACCPSRSTFFTGQYPHNHLVKSIDGIEGGYRGFHVQAPKGSLTRPTLATWLKSLGYRTGLVGKYLNGYGAYDADGSGPLQRPTCASGTLSHGRTLPAPSGWDYFRPLVTPDYDTRPGEYAIRGLDGMPECPTVYQTKQIGDLAAWNLGQFELTDATPFFLVLTPTAPHVNTKPMPGVIEAINDFFPDDSAALHPQFVRRIMADRSGYSGYAASEYSMCGGSHPAGCLRRSDGALALVDSHIPKPGFDLPGLSKASFDASGIGQPTWMHARWADLDWGQVGGKTNLDKLRRQHLDRLEAMLSIDVMVGKLFDKLDQLGETDNTLIVFTSDNGFMLGEHRLGNKMGPQDEAIRVPLVIRTPNSSGQHGGINDTRLVANIDLAPTLIDYAGGAWSTATPQAHETLVDGRSLKPSLGGGTTGVLRDRLLIEHWYGRDPSKPPVTDVQRQWYEMPDYSGIRTDPTSSKNWGNQTYVEYPPLVENGVVIYPADVTHYRMAASPWQTNNIAASTAALDVDARLTLKAALSLLRGCAGETCRKADVAHGGSASTSVSRYADGPCNGKSGDECTFDSRSVPPYQGSFLESITAYGQYFNFLSNGAYHSSASLGSVPRYMSNAGIPGPCAGVPASCVFDTRSHFTVGGVTTETITAYGKLWDFQGGVVLGDRNGLSVASLYPAVCEGRPSCSFDSRAHPTINGAIWDSITAYDKYWNYISGSLQSSDTLTSVPRYADGPCQNPVDGTLRHPCVFEARTHLTINGVKIESIQAYGRYWNFAGNYRW